MLVLLALLSVLPASAQPVQLTIPDTPVVDQSGAARHFYSDLVRDRVVVINFIFTSCTTICPTMGATFAKLQELAGDRKVSLISVSVDPATDTPERLAAWSRRLGARPGWTLVTGRTADIDQLLKSLGVFTGDRNSHTPLVLAGDARRNNWQRASGLAAPSALLSLIDSVSKPEQASSGAGEYFKDIVLTDQNGRRLRLYEDLMQGHTIVLNSFFTSCQGSCPVMSRTYGALQERFAGRLGKDLTLISITVDPEHDTPAKLKEYAAKQNAGPSWVMVTGTKDEVEQALRKLGQYAESREAHLNIMIIGNDRTGLWKKAFALAKPDEIALVVDSVLNDKGAPDVSTR